MGSKIHVAISFGVKLVCVDGKFSKPFNHLGEDAVYSLINSMIEESIVLILWLNKELVMIKEDDEDHDDDDELY